jgi:peptide/nickel transport system permease protein
MADELSEGTAELMPGLSAEVLQSSLGLATPVTSTGALSARYRRPRPIQFWGSIAVIALLVFFCFIGPHIFHLPGPNSPDFNATSKGFFTKGHLLGTDELGRDLLSRCLWGGQISMVVGVCAVLIGMALGSAFGMLAAYLGGVVDVIVMRVVDMFLAFPSLILALAIAA